MIELGHAEAMKRAVKDGGGPSFLFQRIGAGGDPPRRVASDPHQQGRPPPCPELSPLPQRQGLLADAARASRCCPGRDGLRSRVLVKPRWAGGRSDGLPIRHEAAKSSVAHPSGVDYHQIERPPVHDGPEDPVRTPFDGAHLDRDVEGHGGGNATAQFRPFLHHLFLELARRPRRSVHRGVGGAGQWLDHGEHGDVNSTSRRAPARLLRDVGERGVRGEGEQDVVCAHPRTRLFGHFRGPDVIHRLGHLFGTRLAEEQFLHAIHVDLKDFGIRPEVVVERSRRMFGEVRLQ